MVAVWRRAASFDPARAAASTWIFAIARNRRIDLFRRAGPPGARSRSTRCSSPSPRPTASRR